MSKAPERVPESEAPKERPESKAPEESPESKAPETPEAAAQKQSQNAQTSVLHEAMENVEDPESFSV